MIDSGRERRDVFLHAGTGRASSTWLQSRVFPKLPGVRYIPPGRFKKSLQIISGEAGPVLVSRQMSPQERDWFSAAMPHTRPILVLRRQDSWIASIHRNEIEHGGFVPFDAFLDLDRDRGRWRQSWGFLRARIQRLEGHFQYKPFILFFDDVLADPGEFVRTLAEYVGASYEPGEISLQPVNQSYAEKRLRVMRAIALRRPSGRPQLSKNPVSKWLQVQSRAIVVHAVLGVAKLVPEDLPSREPLVRPEQLERVREFYAEDWQACRDYARANNPKLQRGAPAGLVG